MALVIAPASALDLLEAFDDAGAGAAVRGRARFGRMARQVAGGVALSVRDEAGALAICGGLHPEGDGAEAWFAAGPALRPRAAEAVRLWRRALDEIGAAAAPLDVWAYVRPAAEGGVAGARLAALFGFRDEGVVHRRDVGPLRAFVRSFPE